MADRDVLFRNQVKDAITYYFVNHVKPYSVLHIIPTISRNVLTEADKQRVRAEALANGDQGAAYTLLDSIVNYKDWFPCLLKVLRHEDVKQGHVADKLVEIYDSEYDKFYNHPEACPEIPISPPVNASQGQVNWRDDSKKDEDPLSTFTVDCKEENTNMHHDGPMMGVDKEQEEYESDAEDGYQVIDIKEDPQEKSNIPSNMRQMAPLPPAPVMPLPNIPREKMRHVHGPEYNFTRFETTEAMKSFPGWHEQISERKVEETLLNLAQENGHYILWYWDRKKRPGMCVTYRKKIKTFIVHKSPAKTPDRKTQFYIERNGRYDLSLKTLVSYHLEKGIYDPNTNENISFLQAVQPEE